VVQAPALHNGYGADPFPGLAQAIRDGKWSQAQSQIDIIVDRIGAVQVVLTGKKPAENETVVIVLAAIWAGLCVVAVAALILYFVYRVVQNRRSSYEIIGGEDTTA